MSERRFTEEEVSEILKYATEAQHSETNLTTRPSGLTLSELNEIGREVGISPEAMQIAVRKVDKGTPATEKLLGLPIAVGRTVELDRKLTEDEWERLVANLRGTFRAKGVVKSEGSLRSWSNGNLQVWLEPTATGQRLRLQTLNGNARMWIGVGLMTLGVGVALSLAALVKGTLGDGGYLGTLTMMGAIGAGMIGLGAFTLPGWARTRQQQMDQIADMIVTETNLVSKGD